MRRVVQVLVLAVLLALGTWLLGWWAVPALALVYGLTMGGPSAPGRVAALAAALAWGCLLLAAGSGGHPLGPLASRLSALLTIPAAGLYAATLVLPALLGGSAAALGGALRPR